VSVNWSKRLPTTPSDEVFEVKVTKRRLTPYGKRGLDEGLPHSRVTAIIKDHSREYLDGLTVPALAAEYYKAFGGYGYLTKGVSGCVCVTCKSVEPTYRLKLDGSEGGLSLCRACITADLLGEARPKPPFV
jgi:hypothetical protein